MALAEAAIDHADASAAAPSDAVDMTPTPSNVADTEASSRAETDANDRELASESTTSQLESAVSSPPTTTALDEPAANALKRPREDGDADHTNDVDPVHAGDDAADDGDDPNDDDASAAEDECARRFSLAQVRVRVKRARLDARHAVQDDMTALRVALLRAEQLAQQRAREKEHAEQRAAALQASLDEIVQLHQRTLHGMRDNLPLETLVASLDKEKATKAALRETFQQQNAELLRAQQRVAALEAQVAKYQKTETVLAQSLAHAQAQFAGKDHERAAQLERLKHELEAQHVATRRAFEQDVQRLTRDRDALHDKLQQLQAEHVGLQETAQAVVEMQETREAEQLALRARVAQLDTEKAVLASKVDQVQKADAQLRSKIAALEEHALQLQHANDELRRENVELGKIASDLMDMAEQQHAEKQQLTHTPDKAGDERLARTRTRLRESLG